MSSSLAVCLFASQPPRQYIANFMPRCVAAKEVIGLGMMMIGVSVLVLLYHTFAAAAG